MNADQGVPNKRIIEEVVAEVGGELGLKLETDWTDAPSKMENYKLRIRCEESGKSTVLEFPSKELWFKTWMQEPGEDIAEFLKNEKELRPESYERKKSGKPE